MPHTSAAFVIDSQQPRTFDLVDDTGVDYGGLTLSKTFTGAIEGTSTVEMLYTRTPGEDGSFAGAGYVALERIPASVDGRTGSFVLLHISTVLGKEPPLARYLISPGSGTGELAGISGVGLITIGDDGAHALHLDYEWSRHRTEREGHHRHRWGQWHRCRFLPGACCRRRTDCGGRSRLAGMPGGGIRGGRGCRHRRRR